MTKHDKIFWWGSSIFVLLVLAFPIAVSSQWLYYTARGYYPGNGTDHAIRVANIAYQKNDPEICGKIRWLLDAMGPTEISMQHSCYFQVAVLTKNPAVCDYIKKDDYYRDICVRDAQKASTEEAL